MFCTVSQSPLVSPPDMIYRREVYRYFLSRLKSLHVFRAVKISLDDIVYRYICMFFSELYEPHSLYNLWVISPTPFILHKSSLYKSVIFTFTFSISSPPVNIDVESNFRGLKNAFVPLTSICGGLYWYFAFLQHYMESEYG